MKFCKAPFTGMTIDPLGFIVLCCNSVDRKNNFIKITEVNDLHEYFLGEQYKEWRNKISSQGFDSIPSCLNCTNASKDNLNGEYLRFDQYNISNPLKINYLEVTNSNICNQICSTCGSFYSTKWQKQEKHLPEWARHNVKTNNLSDESISKIIKVIPQLEVLELKGGEPFADKNNLKLLKELLRCNPKCQVVITSNFHHISDEWWETLSKLENLSIGASIDGIFESYDWIRSGNFQNTYDNIEKFISITGIKPTINVCVSVYNILTLHEIRDFFPDFNVSMSNVVNTPTHLSPNIINTDDLKAIVYDQFYGAPPKDLIDSLDFKSISSTELVNKFKEHTNALNKVRKSNIFEIQPKLHSLFY